MTLHLRHEKPCSKASVNGLLPVRNARPEHVHHTGISLQTQVFLTALEVGR